VASVFTAGSASVNVVPDFSNAQKTIGAWFAGQDDVHIKVVPDIDQTRLAALRTEVGAQHEDMHVGLDASGFHRSLAKLVDELTGLSVVTSVFEKLFGPKSILMVNGVGALTAIASAASQAAGAALLLPAAFSAMVVPIATVAVGVQGISEAFKALASGDIAKVAAAMQNLAPSARDFVQQIHALGPAWTALRLDVQQKLFQGLGDAITELAQAQLPTLRKGLSETAVSLNGLVTGIAKVLASRQSVQDFGSIFHNVADATTIASGGFAAITRSLVSLTAVGSEFLPRLATAFTDVANAADRWLQRARDSGQLTLIINEAIAVLDQLGRILLNIASIFSSVFQAASTAGATLLSIVEQLTGSIAAFLRTPVAQSALNTFFTNIADAISTLMPAINTLVQVFVTSLLPAISGVVKTLAPLAGTLLTQFATLLQQIAPLIYPTIANAISAWLAATSPLIPIIGELATTLLPIFAQILTELAPYVSELAELVGHALLEAIQVLAPLIPQLADAFFRILDAILPLIPPILDLAVQLLPPLVKIVEALLPVFVDLVTKAILPLIPPLLQIVQALLPPLVLIINALLPIIPPLADAFIAVVQALLPILPVIAELITLLLPPLIKLLTPLIELFGDFLVTAVKAFAAVLGFLVDVLVTVINFVVDFIKNFSTYWQNFLDFAKNLWTTVWTAVRDFFVTIWTAIRDFFVNIWNNIFEFFRTVLTAIRDFFVTVWNNVFEFFRTILTNIRDFFVTIWNAVFDFFSNIITNIRDFFVSIWNGIYNFFSNVLTNIRDFFVSIWNGIHDTAVTIWNAISGFFSNAFEAFKNAFSTVWNTIKDAFISIWQGMKDAVASIWEGIKAVFAAPINFVIRYILNDGLFKAWNWIVDALNLPGHDKPATAAGGWKLHVDEIAGFSRGGYTGDLPREAPAGVVHGGEYVFTKRQTDAAGVDALADYAAALDAGYRDGGPVVARKLAAWLPGYAAGGSVTWPQLWNIIRAHDPSAILTSGYRPGANDYHGAGEAIDISYPGNPQSRLMPLAAWIASTYPGSTELIHNPNASIKNGRVVPASFWGAATWAAHQNHVHWAEAPGALLAGASASGSGAVGSGGIAGFFGNIWHTITDVLGDLTRSITKPLSDLFSQFGSDGVGGLIGGVPGGVVKMIWDGLSSEIGKYFAAIASDDSNTPGDVGGLKQQAFATANLMYGWNSAADQSAIDYIVSHESGWKPTAQNPTSSASGLWQMIDGTWASFKPLEASTYRHMKDAPAGMQDKAGIRYLHDRYGSPTAAQSFWAAHHYYDSGGYLPPGYTSVYNGTGRPEPVLTAAEHDALVRWQGQHGRGGEGESADRLMRDVHIHADGQRAGQIMDELWHRLQVEDMGGKFR
jgi:phage-related protein